MERYKTASLELKYQRGAVSISLYNVFICFFSKVKKDLTMVQAKYVPNPEKDQLTVLKVTKYDRTSTNNLGSYHERRRVLKHMIWHWSININSR